MTMIDMLGAIAYNDDLSPTTRIAAMQATATFRLAENVGKVAEALRNLPDNTSAIEQMATELGGIGLAISQTT